MIDLNDFLKCQEHEAPYLICIIQIKKVKKILSYEFTVICPVDQNIETLSTELSHDELEKIYFPLADKIYRCEKCFREAEILDTVIEKNKVSIYLSCIEHGRLIIREISSVIYDKIRSAWDIKDIKKEEEMTY